MAAGDLKVNRQGQYIYLRDHRLLDARQPLKDPVIPEEGDVVNSPLVAAEWEAVLAGHPDRELAEFLTRSIREGFHIGFDYGTLSRCRTLKNMRSAN